MNHCTDDKIAQRTKCSEKKTLSSLTTGKLMSTLYKIAQGSFLVVIVSQAKVNTSGNFKHVYLYLKYISLEHTI